MTRLPPWLRRAGACVLLVALHLTAAADPAARSAAEPPAIVVLGDSLSAGYGIRPAEGWVAGLAHRLEEQGYGYRVINASVSGATSADGLARVGHVLATQHPAVVLLELGANDGLRGLPAPAMRQNLAGIVQACRKGGAAVLLVGMRMPENYGPEYTARFAEAYASLAREEHLPFVPFLLAGVGPDLANFQADGLHPTAAAQGAILDTVWPTLRGVLKAPAAVQHGTRARGR